MHLSPAPLHIPDGFLNITVSLFSWAISILVLSVALRRGTRESAERQIPLMGVMAAFIFAAQMINFPVFGGTSGHLLGGVLAAITLGPWGGIIVMASVVALQALLFQDGGLLVMGANILNMGIVTVLIGFGLYRMVSGRGKRLRLGVAGGAAWLGVMAAALLTSLQLWLSGTAPAGVVFPAMLGVHALIGIGEGLITVAALSFVGRIRPALLDHKTIVQHGGYGWVAGGLSIALGVVLLSPFASTNPDGLERVAADLGFLQAGYSPFYEILPDYIIPVLGETRGSTVLAGTIGTLIVAGLTYLIGRKLQGIHLRVRE